MKLKGILQISLVMVFLTIVARLLSLAREIVIADKIGMNILTDAFNVSQSAVTFATSILGASCAALVPLIIHFSKLQNGEKRRDQVFTSIFLAYMVIALIVAACFAIFAEPIIQFLAPGFEWETVELGAVLLRIGFLKINCVIAGTLFGYYLQSKRIFISTCIAAVLQSAVVVILLLLIPDPTIYDYTTFTVVGYFAQVITLIPFIISSGYRPSLKNVFEKEAFLKLLASSVPLAVSSVCFTLHFILARFIASSMDAGLISSIDYASKIAQLVFALFTMSINTVLLTYMSNARNKIISNPPHYYLIRGLKIQVLFAFPVVILLLIFGDSAVALLYQRGSFNSENTQEVAYVLCGYLLGCIGYIFNDLAAKYFVTVDNNRIINLSSIFGYGFSFILLVPLSTYLGTLGISLSFAIAQCLISVIYVYTLRRAFISYLKLEFSIKKLFQVSLLLISFSLFAFVAGTIINHINLMLVTVVGLTLLVIYFVSVKFLKIKLNFNEK